MPKAARIKGMALNDVLLEFDPNSPQRGTNYGVPWMPIAIRDFAGRELVRVYTDEWGKYNAIVPSTYTVNSPIPTGVSPHMLQICMNDPGPIPDLAHPGQKVIDPFYKTNHRRDCLTFDFWPGKTTYLDTPILPLGAFSANKVPPDCDYPSGTPLIQSAFGPGVFNGPYVPTAGSTLTLNAVGQVGTVDHGFGSTKGTVRIGTQLIPAANVTWSASTIAAVIPAGVPTGQLVVTRGDNSIATPVGLTVQVGAVSCGGGGPPPPASQCVLRVPAQYATIQAAVDAAPRDALILVGPGLFHENVIMYKRVKLQGSGLGTVIEAGPVTPEQQLLWDAKLASLRSAGLIDTITNQALPNYYFEPGAGILVTGRNNTFGGSGQSMARVDGFTVTNASTAGAIYVNAFADNLRITNNRLAYNAGNFGGGLRVGTPSIPTVNGNSFVSSRNRNMRISSNHITGNGAVDGGGGLSLFNGSDNYEVSDNFICGNFTLLYGGGIAHFGLSSGGQILRNKIVSNQSFDEGGGLIVAGELVSFDANAPLTPGSGSVTIDENLIQGNLAGDDGGGIRTLMVNGQDVQGNPASWHTINIFNNMIVNNSSADAGGGISLDDTLRAFIIHNTIAHNDSTATGPDAFGPCTGPICAGLEGGGITTSVPQVAGIGAFVTSAALEAVSGQPYPDPYLRDNIVYENRSFYWDSDYNAGLGGLRPDVVGGEAPYYWDLGVYGVPGATPLLHPQYCILTDATLYPGAHNSAANPLLGDAYFNTYAVTSKGAAFGNFVTVTFPETGLWPSDYHIAFGSPAVNAGDTSYLMSPALRFDYDRQARPLGTAADIGADELQ